MKRWLFVLGRQPAIGLAELLSVLTLEHVQHTSSLIDSHVFMVETDDTKDLALLLPRLGGTIKVGVVDAIQPSMRDSRATLRELLKSDAVIRDYARAESGRWTFGLSVYTRGTDPTLARSVHDFGLDLKRYLKSRKRSARFVEPRGKSLALSSVVVRGNGLLKQGGTEVLLILTPTQAYRAHTVAVQDFASYSERDYGRPERNPKAGSLPPKLAQIMLNLAGLKKNELVVDPFCGIGTVLQEALLMGYRAQGSDSDTDQVNRARANLKWLAERYKTVEGRVSIATAESLIARTGSIDAIVTEGVLGPPRARPLSMSEASQVVQQVLHLWGATLRHARELLAPKGSVVLTLPVLKVVGQVEPLTVPLLDELQNLGYRHQALLPERFVQPQGLLPLNSIGPRGTLVYERPDQIVGRELIKLIKL